MAYIGDKPSQTLASPTSQYFNGDGSTVAFTLNRPVNVSEDLEVFVNNIQQEPGVGKSYTATGTTLTFDAAPSSGTGNVYVVYRGLAEVTTRLEHDPNAALAATTGTFSSNVGIETSSPQGVLDLGDGTAGTGIVWGGPTGTNHYGSIWSEYGTASIVIGAGLKGSTSSSDFIFPYTGTYGYAAIELDSFSNEGIKFYTGGSASRTSGASATKNERMRLDSDGLKFNGDTAAANALDDYEEGTWTPYWGGSTSDPTVTYSEQVGTYTKVGRIVHASMRLVTSAYSGGSGNLRIKGLPFARATNGNESDAVTKGFVYGFSTDIDVMLAVGSEIHCYSSDNNNTQNPVSSPGSSAYFSASFTYRT